MFSRKDVTTRTVRVRAAAILAAVGCMLAVSTGSASAAISIVNPSFETGTLAGWGGSGFVTTSYAGYTAPNGSYFAGVSGGCATNTLAQTFTASAGDTLTGWAFFKANDYLPYNDNGSVQMILTSGPFVLATLFSSSVGAVGNFGGTPWTAWSHTFSSTGSFELRIQSSNVNDCSLSSVVGIDLVDQPPVLQLPASITAEATSASGAAVTYTATATDDFDPSPAVSCSPASGSTFPLGTTTVNCTATDAAGNSSSGSFTVTVADATAPAVTCTNGPNPSGKNEPNGSAGFRTIAATDAVGVVTLQIADSASSFVSSNLSSGWNLKLTQSPGNASEKDMAGVVSKHINTTGAPKLRAVDAAGNVTQVNC